MSLSIGELIGVVTLRDEFSAAANNISKSAFLSGESFKAITGAASLAAGGIALAAGAIVTLGQRGAAVADVQGAFDDLSTAAGSSADVMLGALQTGTQGTISNFDLMKASTGLLSSGLIKSADDMGTLAAGAKLLADRTGGDTATAFDTLSGAIASGRTNSLKQLGLFVDSKKAAEDYAASIGKTPDKLSAHEQAAGLAAGVTAELKKQLELAGPPVKDFGDFIDIGKTAVKNFTDNLGVAIATSPVVMTAMGGIADAVQKAFGGTQQDAVKTLQGYVNKFAIFLVDAAGVGVEAARLITAAFDGTKFVLNAVLEGVATGIGKVAQFLADFATKASTAPGWIGDAYKPLATTFQGVADTAKSMALGFGEMKDKAIESSNESEIAFGVLKAGIEKTGDAMRAARDAGAELASGAPAVAGGFRQVADAAGFLTDEGNKAIQGWIDYQSKAFDASQAVSDRFKTLQDDIALLQTTSVDRQLLEIWRKRDEEIASLQAVAFEYPTRYEELTSLVQEKYGLMAEAATGASKTMVERAQDAGFKSQEALQTLADEASRLYGEMKDSGLFTTKQVKEAWEKAEAAKRVASDLTKSNALENFGIIAADVSGILKSVFGKNKVAAIAAAIIDTAAAVVKALASAPPPLNYVSAAAVGIAGLVQINKIKGQDLGFAEGTLGTRFEDFGRGTAATLHGSEAIVTRRQASSVADMVEDAINLRDDRAAAETRALRDEMRQYNNSLPRLLRDAVLLAPVASA